MRKNGSKAILFLMVLSLLLSACGGRSIDNGPTNSPVWPPGNSSGNNSSAKSIILSPENTSAVDNGVTIDVGDFVYETSWDEVPKGTKDMKISDYLKKNDFLKFHLD